MIGKRSLIIAAIAAVGFGSFALWGGLSHNIQCEFFCDGQLDWGYALSIFAVNAAAAFVAVSIVLFCVRLLFR